jgi:5-methylcytosine-specific restriction endonuclease McrA
VLELYWRQVRPFEGHAAAVHQQLGTNPACCQGITRRIGRVVVECRNDDGTGGLSVVHRRHRLCGLAQQPLFRLQRLPGADINEPFLYDDSFLHSKVSRGTLRAHGDAIVLTPGVATGLARLAGLLKPVLEIMWVDDVRRMNRFLTAEVPDIAGHLFGRDRTALAAVRGPFKQAFTPHCFYCNTHLPADNPIDHVLPWSLAGIDGLANLVLACSRCNSDKRHALPAIGIIDRVLGRDQVVLEQIAEEIRWPTEYHRVVAAARDLRESAAGDLRRGRGTRRVSGWISGFGRCGSGTPATVTVALLRRRFRQ